MRFLLINTMVLPYLVDKTISLSTRSPTKEHIAAHCNVDLQTEKGDTTLHYSVYYEHTTVTKQLHIVDKGDLIALQAAQGAGHTTIVMLIRNTNHKCADRTMKDTLQQVRLEEIKKQQDE